MIVKPFAKTLHAESLAQLFKRLPKSHPKYAYIRDEMMQKIAGDIGEEAVMRELEKLKLPFKYYLFHNVSFFSESYFQMDILLISPYFAMVLEVKNISSSTEIKTNPTYSYTQKTMARQIRTKAQFLNYKNTSINSHNLFTKQSQTSIQKQSFSHLQVHANLHPH